LEELPVIDLRCDHHAELHREPSGRVFGPHRVYGPHGGYPQKAIIPGHR
jgi:hypothetical protein